MMTIIADSGSTKTDWTIIGENSAPTYIHTQGINPVLMSKEEIETILRKELIEQLPPHTSHLETRNSNLFFYGAGVREEQIPKMQEAFHSSFHIPHSTFHIPHSSFHIPHSTFHVDFTFSSDLLAAARAVCGHNEGIACILGTGANSCLYDGVRIVQNTPALGFILGDEGGGASLGKRFLNAIFKGELPASMRDDYLHQTGQTLADIIRKVYSEPMPNRFLASTSLYIGSHLDEPLLRQLIVDNFRLFFRRNLLPYQRKDLPVGVVGSIGWHYQEQLREAAEAEGFTLGTIIKSPMEGLIRFHS